MTYNFPNIKKLLQLHNEARSKGSWMWNIEALELDDKLTDYAQDWAEKMADNGYLKHGSMRNIMRLGFSPVAENIAYGQKDEKSVMKSWLWSPGHRRNIMNKSFTHIGCGFAYSNKDVLYWCVCFGKKKS